MGKQFALLLAAFAICQAQPVGSLRGVPVPKPATLGRYVSDERALVVLGKALFWDTQVSSDGRIACASCHFHAGADHRAQNQLSNAHGSFAANHTLTMADFPFGRQTPQVTGSAGLARRMFASILPGIAAEDGYDAGDLPAFALGGINVRQVTGRNTPSVINAIFNVRNFWDGRASSVFSGLTPFGEGEEREAVLAWRDGHLVTEKLALDRASLASQAVGPPLNSVEMSYDGRSWENAARKILGLRPLAHQRVSPDDSVLGQFANPQGRGLAVQATYLDLIQTAFRPEYWSGPRSTAGPTHAEWNFTIFFGLAIQAYEATLVSDDSPFDRFSAGDRSALSLVEQQGLGIFNGRGDCNQCHTGPEFTAASYTSFNQRGPLQLQRNLTADTGFFRLGVRSASEDAGLGGLDGFGRPLSISPTRNGVTAAFKAPGLRNVELTGPYFHNGGQATLEQVVDFYSRGGDFPEGGVAIRARNFSANDRTQLVAFLKSLTDDRVRFERAPFDHPELCIPAGHLEEAPGVARVDSSDDRFSFSAADKWVLLPPVGRAGNSAPLQSFQELLQGVGSDGSRAHHLGDACTPE